LERVLVEAARLCKKYEAQLSVDTYHPETMHLALQSGVTIINDVSGLRDPRGRNVFFNSTCDWVVMHNLGLPANKGVVLDHSKLAHQHIIDWVRDLEKHIPREHRHRLILDPGIGFGKSAEQSRDILKNWFVLKDLGYRVLIGHSRKSFLSGITQSKASDRDIETVALSLRLASEGVDILRIHKMDDHRRAHLAYLA
jgi:dihydropteroate synthase